MDDIIRVNNEYFIRTTSSRVDDRTRVLKHGDTFAVFDRFGDIQVFGQGEQGIYYEGTRFLSRYELLLGEQRPLLLNSTVTQGNIFLTVDLTNPELFAGGPVTIHHGELHLFRSKLLWHNVCYEHIRVSNFADHHVDVPIVVVFQADFADVFEVRGTCRRRKGQHLEHQAIAGGILIGYEGLDGVRRHTRLVSTLKPAHVSGSDLRLELSLAPGEVKEFFLNVVCELPGHTTRYLAYGSAVKRARKWQERAREGECRIYTANEQFNDWINRSYADLHMLITDTDHGPYPYAGVPWYSTVFGRDGILTALHCLWVNPKIARGVLGHLAATQAREKDPEKDAEPGKILHETRKGEMAALGEIPFGNYYGTVDATPLFVMLAGAYYERSGDREFVEGIWPNLEQALAWMDRDGDKDRDGFVEYLCTTPRGLANQGWKDSHDSVFHADGKLAVGAIALCEVQGYVYAAKHAAARLARLFGENRTADALETSAEALKINFNNVFWCPEISTYAIALDGRKQPCQVRTSNAGHALFTGIASDEYAKRTAKTLLNEDSFSGWGVRTVSAQERRYNPMSYHNGSVWPHDNAMIAHGLARYGFKEASVEILRGLFDASIFLDLHRLPELFCGFARRSDQGPTLYPVACLPQAWTSTTVFFLLQACLGLSFSREKPQVRFTHPVLPQFLEWIEIKNLRVDSGSVDLILRRHPQDVSINILRSDGDIEVVVVL
ncbi:MAG: glycogen debranching N-terminal domain-containing protein [Acidiferrobacterales bacterium]